LRNSSLSCRNGKSLLSGFLHTNYQFRVTARVRRRRLETANGRMEDSDLFQPSRLLRLRYAQLLTILQCLLGLTKRKPRFLDGFTVVVASLYCGGYR